MDNPSRVRMSGPLESYRHGFTTELGRLGYSKFTFVALLHLMAHLSRWLEEQGLGAGDLTDDCVERFLAARRASGQVRRLSPRGLIPLLDYLRRLDVAPGPLPPVASTPLERLLEEFTGFLPDQRAWHRVPWPTTSGWLGHFFRREGTKPSIWTVLEPPTYALFCSRKPNTPNLLMMVILCARSSVSTSSRSAARSQLKRELRVPTGRREDCG